MNRRTFEYKISSSVDETTLNTLGADGWEMCGVQTSALGNGTTLYFKREIPTPEHALRLAGLPTIGDPGDVVAPAPYATRGLDVAVPDDLCTCPCHQPGGPMHMFPCCKTCPVCFNRIKTEMFTAHFTREHTHPNA